MNFLWVLADVTPTVVHVQMIGSPVLKVVVVALAGILLFRPVMSLIKKLPFL